MGKTGSRAQAEKRTEGLAIKDLGESGGPQAAAPSFYGRRKGRPLTAHRVTLTDTLLPAMQVALPREGALTPAAIFRHAPEACWLEIGFGGGEHLAAQAAANPAAGMIGSEPFVNGVASLLAHIDTQGLRNVRIFPDDARLLLDKLPDASIARCFVLFPDPWPKKRHARRRFIGPENLPRLARVMQPGAQLRLATDDPGLQQWFAEQMAGKDADAFTPAPGSYAGLLPARPDDWPATRYEQKAVRQGRAPAYYMFVRR
ncbi:MAG: tRNA (guanosine(46)-N7)-methyltransferase TrmB [Alphaproteobacteria bacterium]|nr:tRNA (guanosine(46)-N7)-methyltransferase TrmB [Alphaproteobacteria bacterium]